MTTQDREAVLGRRDVSRETIALLDRYEALLRGWQRRTNLVAPSTLDSIWSRHFEEGLALGKLLPSGAANLVDLGSGGGLPGLVLAILSKTEGGPRVTMIESNGKKAAFLRMVARDLNLACTIEASRIEERGETIGRADIVTARALASLETLCDLVGPHLSGAGTCLFPKGRDHAAEIAAASQHWQFGMVKHPSTGEPGSVVLELSVLRRRTER